MKADPNDTTGGQGAAKPETMRTARRIAERVLADLERAARQAQAERLAEILLLLADGEALKDPLSASSPAE